MDFEHEIMVPSKCEGGPLHDLSTPLGLAYERYMAYKEITVPKEMDHIMSVLVEANKPILSVLDYHARLTTKEERFRAANCRREQVKAIEKGLLADIKKAKRDAGQWY